MPPSTPFIDRETGEIDHETVLAEAVPLAKLVGLVVAVALVPLFIAFLVFEAGFLTVVGELFTLVAQFVLAVGAGVVLLYIVSRAIQLADG